LIFWRGLRLYRWWLDNALFLMDWDSSFLFRLRLWP